MWGNFFSFKSAKQCLIKTVLAANLRRVWMGFKWPEVIFHLISDEYLEISSLAHSVTFVTRDVVWLQVTWLLSFVTFIHWFSVQSRRQDCDWFDFSFLLYVIGHKISHFSRTQSDVLCSLALCPDLLGSDRGIEFNFLGFWNSAENLSI